MDAREDGVYITYVPAAGADTVTKKLGSGFSISDFYAQGGGNDYAYAHLTLNVADASKVILGGYMIDNEAHFYYSWLTIKIDNETIINTQGNSDSNKNAIVNALKSTYDVTTASTFYIMVRTTANYKFGIKKITVE